MLATLVVMSVLVGIFLGVSGVVGACIILSDRDEKKRKNPYLPSRSEEPTNKVGPNPFENDKGTILKYQ